ncbi:unnamed protein product [Mytilus coruscus]|uniref:Uncharacterized protein n=1 Tax=Mytilus coruscus TaxID=42192 RepID=A0A6J8ATS1_MYTCO|nr:unnamed protein product [Mytilus coruscus]
MICRVFASEGISLPANCYKWVDIQFPSAKVNDEPVYIESLYETVIEISGIVQPQSDKLSVLVANFNNEDIDLYPNTQLGTCESCSKRFSDTDARCARVAVNDHESSHSQLPEYLKDMWERSPKHLTTDKSEKVAALFVKFQNVSSKTSEDIGRTENVQHRIDTGNAIKQMPRRLPLGKREIERQEVHKMLER